jgi:hypothetical protein
VSEMALQKHCINECLSMREKHGCKESKLRPLHVRIRSPTATTTCTNNDSFENGNLWRGCGVAERSLRALQCVEWFDSWNGHSVSNHSDSQNI